MSMREYQDVDYSPLSILSTISLILMSLMLVVFQFKTLLFSGLNRLALLLMIMGIISTLLYGRDDLLLIKQIIFIVFWEAVLFLFYFLSFYDYNTINDTSRFFLILIIPITVLLLMSNVLRGSMGYKVSQLGNNMIFYLLTLLPWLLASKRQSIRLLSVLFVLAMSVFCLKRSAMMSSIICTLIVIYVEFIKGNANKVGAVCLSILFVFSAFGLMYYTNRINDGAAVERVENLEDDEGSGRLERYRDVLKLLRDEDNKGKIVFGHGYRTVEEKLGESSSAHNDFLEVLYDYGIIGLLLFALFHLSLIKRVIFLRKIESEYAEGYMVSYVIFFIMSMVSHLIIYPTYFIFLTSYWGAIEGHLIAIDENEQ